MKTKSNNEVFETNIWKLQNKSNHKDGNDNL